MPNAAARFGATMERELAEMFEADGWVVIRSAGSLGPADLLAFRWDRVAMFIQVKAGREHSTYTCFPPAQRQALSYMAEQAGADAYLARWRSAQKFWDLIPESEWPTSKRGEADYVIVDGHWIWQKGLTTDGYGAIGRDGRHLAHRWYYEQRYGPIPDGLQLDHLCRVRRCVNPDHLEPVTQAENVLRGRLTRLTNGQVRAIRASDEPSSVLADRYGVTRGWIWKIRTGQVRPSKVTVGPSDRARSAAALRGDASVARAVLPPQAKSASWIAEADWPRPRGVASTEPIRTEATGVVRRLPPGAGPPGALTSAQFQGAIRPDQRGMARPVRGPQR